MNSLHPAARALSILAALSGPALVAQDGWRRETPQAVLAVRQGHAMAYDPVREQVILFGGAGFTTLVDQWAWTGTDWTRLPSPTALLPRVNAAVATDLARREVVLFGGQTPSSGFMADTWVWDGATWVQRNPVHSPPGRTQATLTADPVRGTLLLSGGATSAGIARDVWEWDGIDWSEIAPSLPVPAVYSSPTFFDPVGRERVVLFGNNNNTHELLSGTWEWDGTAWRALLSAALSPPRRVLSAAAFDPHRARGIVFGGDNGQSLDDTWEWHVDGWSLRTWIVRPPARRGHAMAFDPIRDEVVLFGGEGTSLFGDTWVYRVAITEPADVAPLGPGCAGPSGTPELIVPEGRGPWLGEDLKLVVHHLPPALFGTAFGMIGTTSGTFGGSPIPYDVGRLGAPGCVLHVAPLDAVALVRLPTGDAVWRVHVPDDARLLGLEFGVQALVLDHGANPLGIVLSDAQRAVVGRR